MLHSMPRLSEGEADLRSCALSHGHDAVLFWVENLAHFAHGLGVGRAGGEVAVPVQPAEQAPPPVVPLSRVGQAPGHQRLALHMAHRVLCLAPANHLIAPDFFSLLESYLHKGNVRSHTSSMTKNSYRQTYRVYLDAHPEVNDHHSKLKLDIVCWRTDESAEASAHLEGLLGGIFLHNGLQHPPVGPRLLLGDATAALQVQGVHLLADVVPQLGLPTPDLLLEG